jgi:hypothetical protein
MTTEERIECTIDVLSRPQQRAMARRDITPVEMVQAIVDEFSEEIPHLGRNIAAYQITQIDTGHILEMETPLDRQIRSGARLALQERTTKQPPGTKPLTRPFYLREVTQAYVYKINWLPAFIGRTDPSMQDNATVAVDLQNLPNGMRISRRHVRLLERDGVIYLELYSRNPVTLIRAEGSRETLQDRPLVLKHGDIIKLERSNISLQAIFHTEQTTD